MGVDYQASRSSATVGKPAKDGVVFSPCTGDTGSMYVSLPSSEAGSGNNFPLIAPPEGVIWTLCIPSSGDQRPCPALSPQTAAGQCVQKVIAVPEKIEKEQKGHREGQVSSRLHRLI